MRSGNSGKSTKTTVKVACACGRAPQFLVRIGHTRGQRKVAVCGLHASDGLRAFIDAGDTADLRVTVLR